MDIVYMNIDDMRLTTTPCAAHVRIPVAFFPLGLKVLLSLLEVLCLRGLIDVQSFRCSCIMQIWISHAFSPQPLRRLKNPCKISQIKSINVEEMLRLYSPSGFPTLKKNPNLNF